MKRTMPKQYRTKVEAVRVEHGFVNRYEIEAFLGDGRLTWGGKFLTFKDRYGGCIGAYPDYWIVKYWNGRFEAVSPGEFTKHFIPVGE